MVTKAAERQEAQPVGLNPEKPDLFRDIARRTSLVMGTPLAFLAACGIIGLWAISGPLFSFSDTWQLVINTGTTIITFLMVFLIQSTQNRDSRAVQLKLDELIHAVEGARNHLIDLENMSDEELDRLQAEFEHLRRNDRATAEAVTSAVASAQQKAQR